MISKFPHLTLLELSDMEDVHAITSHYEPYSDFDFISMYSWNTEGKLAIAELNDNLVLKFHDYVTGEPFYTFIGTNLPVETVETLLVHSVREGLKPVLNMIPECVTTLLPTDLFISTEQPEHADYIVSVPLLASLDVPELANKRRAINKFKRATNNFRFEQVDLDDFTQREKIIDLFDRWKDIKTENYNEHERQALSRCIAGHFHSSLVATGAYVEDQLEAFWIIGDLENTYGISHFEKDRKSTRLNSSHPRLSRMPSSA